MIRCEFLPRCYITGVSAVDGGAGGDGTAAAAVGSTLLVLVLILLFYNLNRCLTDSGNQRFFRSFYLCIL